MLPSVLYLTTMKENEPKPLCVVTSKYCRYLWVKSSIIEQNSLLLGFRETGIWYLISAEHSSNACTLPLFPKAIGRCVVSGNAWPECINLKSETLGLGRGQIPENPFWSVDLLYWRSCSGAHTVCSHQLLQGLGLTISVWESVSL